MSATKKPVLRPMREDFRNCFRLRFDAAPPNSEHRDEALRNRICAPVNIKSEKETSVVVRGGRGTYTLKYCNTICFYFMTGSCCCWDLNVTNLVFSVLSTYLFHTWVLNSSEISSWRICYIICFQVFDSS